MQQPQLLFEGKYEILGKIREGGMGTIYRVRHRLLDEVRVVKAMQPHVVADEDLKRRFLEEAKTAIRLKHPNICTIYDFAADEGGTAYLVMEYIDGVNLADFLKSRGLPGVPLTMQIAHQTLLALGYLHRKGVIHRDIAPDNLMLTHDEEERPVVKLIDLGIAKAVNRAMDMTGTGVFLGKLKYASPEQFGSLPSGEKLDGRSDLYGLGIVLYELLTGKRPHKGESPAELLRAHLFNPPIPFAESDPHARVPPELRALVLRALEKRREDRFQSAEDFDREVVVLLNRYSSTQDLEITSAMLRKIRATQPDVSDNVTPSAQDRLDRQFGAQATPSPSAPIEVLPPVETAPPIDRTIEIPTDQWQVVEPPVEPAPQTSGRDELAQGDTATSRREAASVPEPVPLPETPKVKSLEAPPPSTAAEQKAQPSPIPPVPPPLPKPPKRPASAKPASATPAPRMPVSVPTATPTPPEAHREPFAERVTSRPASRKFIIAALVGTAIGILLVWRPWVSRQPQVPTEEQVATGPSPAVQERVEPTSPPAASPVPTAAPTAHPTAAPTAVPTARQPTPNFRVRDLTDQARVSALAERQGADAARAASFAPGTYRRAGEELASASKLAGRGDNAGAKRSFDRASDLYRQAARLAREQAAFATSTPVRQAAVPTAILRSTAPPPYPTAAPAVVEVTAVPSLLEKRRPSPTALGPQSESEAQDEARQVSKVVQDYAWAQTTQDEKLYAQVFPSGIENFKLTFKNFKTQNVRLEIRTVVFDGPRAAVTAQETVVGKPRAGDEIRNEAVITLQLEKQGNRWIIVSRR